MRLLARKLVRSTSMIRSVLRLSLGLVSAFACLQAIAQDMAKKISYEGTANRTPNVLAEISSLAGINLRAGSDLNNDVIIVRFKDSEVSDVMKQLADALDAEWAKESDGWRLVRSENIRLRQERAEIAARAKQLAESLKSANDVAKVSAEFTSEDAKKLAEDSANQVRQMMQNRGNFERQFTRENMRNFQNSTTRQPGGRAVVKLLNNLRIEDLAALKPGTRTVFSTAPTQMQQRLGNNSLQVVRQFVNEQKQFDQAMSDAMAAVLPTGGTNAPMISFGGPGMRSQTTNTNSVATKALLIVTRFGNTDTLSCQLVVADQDGEYIAQGFFALGDSDLRSEVSSQAPNASEQPIALSDLSKQFIEIVKSASPARGAGGNVVFLTTVDDGNGAVTMSSDGRENSPSLKLSKEWLERFTNPDKFEPLSTVPSDILNGYSKSKESNLIALISDELLMRLARRLVGGGSLKPSEVEAALSDWELTKKTTGNWTLITPAKPDEVRSQRINRTALASMYRTLAANGRLTLDDLAANALAQPEFSSTWTFDEFYTGVLNPSGTQQGLLGRFGNQQQQMLRFYGSLGAAQKNALRNRQPLAYNGMNPAQRTILHSMVYNSADGPRIEAANNGRREREQRELRMEVRNGMAFMSGGNLQTERTEALPNGIPQQTLLNLRIDNEQAVLASAPNGASRILTADGIAQNRLRGEMPQLARFAGGESPQYDKYQMATQSNYEFVFRMTPNISLSRRLEDAIVDARSSAVAYDALDNRFKRDVDRAYERLKQMMSNMRPPGASEGSTPPPRN